MKCELDCFSFNHDFEYSPIDLNRKVRPQRDTIKFLGRSLMILCTFVFIFVLVFLSNPVENAQPVFVRAPHPSSGQETKIILLWTPYFSDTKWNVLSDGKTTELPSCTGCRFTNDRSNLNEADGVVFHGRDINLNDFPSKKYQDQKWIWYLLESPMYTYSLNKMRVKMDCFATYRSDSDIFIPYGTVSPKESSEVLNSENNKTSDQSQDTRQPIAWLVSNCRTKSLREEYVRVLQRYIKVDIYGKCGKSCDNLGLPCHQYLEKNYKFVLSLENSICKDYVTEKLWNSFKYDLIPVVMGGANYSAILPPNSFIDAFNFSSPQNLAEYLRKVANDNQLYSSYFKWKQSYTVKTRSMEQDLCSICKALTSQKSCRHRNIKTLYTWWTRDADCMTWKQKI